MTKGFERVHNIRSFIGKADVDRGREPREFINNREHTDLLPVKELVVDEVHRPDLVGFGRRKLRK